MTFPIRVKNISKAYKLYSTPSDRLKEALFRGKKLYHDVFWALSDVSFDITAGSTIGVIGRNGSGKSTLLQIIAGILQPSEGEVEVNGRVAALLELGSGFDPEFTGRENVYMNASILGLSEKEIDDKFSEIEAFAGIGAFMEQPVKKYSSGMFVRLAFATAVNVNPDILLVDEALAVGDVVFQHRCMSRIRRFQEEGKTIFFVSHDLGAVAKLCTQAILMDSGKMVMMGEPDDVIREYYRMLWTEDQNDSRAVVSSKNSADNSYALAAMKPVEHYDNRIGGVKAEILSFQITDEYGSYRDSFSGGDTVRFQIAVKCMVPIDLPITGVVIRDLLGHEILRTNSDVTGYFINPIKAGGTALISFIFVLPGLRSGSYSLSAGLGNGTIESHQAYDWIENLAVFTVESRNTCYGLLDVPVDIHAQVLD